MIDWNPRDATDDYIFGTALAFLLSVAGVSPPGPMWLSSG